MALILPLPILEARRIKISLAINGKDVLLGLASQSILSFCYTDNTSDKADDLSISIADPDRTWMLRYMPSDIKKGVECQASMTIFHWGAPDDSRKLECGIFWINHVGFKGPPNVVDIKATSIPPNGIKHQKKHRSWESSNLSSISGQIAKENGLTLVYDTKDNPTIQRTDQKDKSDLQYLRDMCKEEKLCLKIHKKQLIIYSEEEYEARPAAFELIYGKKYILDWDFNSQNEDTHDSAENSYVNPETGKLTKTKFKPEEGPEGIHDSALIDNSNPRYEPNDSAMSKLVIVRKEELWDVDNFQNDPALNKGKGKGGNKNSEKKCKAKLREKNKKEHQCSIKTFGNIDYLSGLTVQTIDWGIFDRKWFIESSVHDVGSGGYTTGLKLRGALKGY